MKKIFSADQMFTELGYEKISYSDIEGYQKNTDDGFVRIVFDKNERTMKITHDSWFSLYYETIEEMEPEERAAIYVKLKELGWIFGYERVYYFKA